MCIFLVYVCLTAGCVPWNYGTFAYPHQYPKSCCLPIFNPPPLHNRGDSIRQMYHQEPHHHPLKYNLMVSREGWEGDQKKNCTEFKIMGFQQTWMLEVIINNGAKIRSLTLIAIIMHYLYLQRTFNSPMGGDIGDMAMSKITRRQLWLLWEIWMGSHPFPQALNGHLRVSSGFVVLLITHSRSNHWRTELRKRRLHWALSSGLKKPQQI